MLKLYFKTLFSKKSMMIIMLLCYALSFAAILYSYGNGKQIVYNIYGDAPIIITPQTELTMSGVDSLCKKMQKEGFKGYYSFMTPFGLSALDNQVINNTMSMFTDKNAEIVLSIEDGKDMTYGDKITIDGQEFTVVAISGTVNMINYKLLPLTTQVSDILFSKRAEFTSIDYVKLDKIIASSDVAFEYAKPPKVNLVDGMMNQITIVLMLGVVFLCLITTFVMYFYIIQMRSDFFEVLIASGLPLYRALFYLLLEQVTIFIPMFIVGFSLYLVLHFILIDIIAMLSFLEIFLIAFTFFVLLSAIVIINMITIWRKKMYKLKIGLHIYAKKAILNIIILFQLAVMIVVINSISMYFQDITHLSGITAEVLNSQLIWLEKSNLNDKLDTKSGKLIRSYSSDSSINSLNCSFNFIGIDFLSKLNYKTKKGRLLDARDKDTTNAVVSYTDNFRVGDIVTHTKNGISLNVKIVGILNQNEKLFQIQRRSNSLPFLFDEKILSDVVFYLDVNENCENGSFAFSYRSLLYFGKNPLPQSEYDSLVGTIEGNGDGYSSQTLKTAMDSDLSHVMRLSAPLVVFIFIISFLAFWMICVISFNIYRREFAILKAVGATKQDLVSLLAVYLAIPVIVIITIFTPLSGIPLPIFESARVSLINYLIPTIISLTFVLFNFIMLYFKFFRKNGIEETFYEKKL